MQTTSPTVAVSDDVLESDIGDGPPCEIICRPGWEKLCPTAPHPAEILSVKSCGCRQLICEDAMNAILEHTVAAIGLECQQCHELGIVPLRWFPL
jgi:hypothetical protein